MKHTQTLRYLKGTTLSSIALASVVASSALWTHVVYEYELKRRLSFSDSIPWVGIVTDSNAYRIDVHELSLPAYEASKHIKNYTVQLSANLLTSVHREEEVETPFAASLLLEQGEPQGQSDQSDTDAPRTALREWEIGHVYRLSIPRLHIRAPVLMPSRIFWDTKEWGLLEEQMQVGLNHGAVAYPHSAAPGRRGSLIVAGHSSPPHDAAAASAYGHLFASLPQIQEGDTVTVTSGGKDISYVVESKKIVAPDDTDILAQQSNESIMKLITCYPVGTTENRMIVTARRVTTSDEVAFRN